MVYRSWSKKDNKKFIYIYHNVKNAELAKLFGRTLIAIETKASRLGLKKSKYRRKHIGKKLINNMPCVAIMKKKIERMKKKYEDTKEI